MVRISHAMSKNRQPAYPTIPSQDFARLFGSRYRAKAMRPIARVFENRGNDWRLENADSFARDFSLQLVQFPHVAVVGVFGSVEIVDRFIVTVIVATFCLPDHLAHQRQNSALKIPILACDLLRCLKKIAALSFPKVLEK